MYLTPRHTYLYVTPRHTYLYITPRHTYLYLTPRHCDYTLHLDILLNRNISWVTNLDGFPGKAEPPIEKLKVQN